MSQRYRLIKRAALALAGGVFVTAAGCSDVSKPQSASSPAKQPAGSTYLAGRGRAEIWQETCNRCHNAWSPDQYSATQWQVIMQHMRLRGGLTGEEHDAILEFLQASQ